MSELNSPRSVGSAADFGLKQLCALRMPLVHVLVTIRSQLRVLIHIRLVEDALVGNVLPVSGPKPQTN